MENMIQSRYHDSYIITSIHQIIRTSYQRKRIAPR